MTDHSNTMTPLPFAALVLEREPPTWLALPVESYVQIVGGFAFLLMILALLATSFRAIRDPGDRNSLSQTLFFLAFVVAVIAYLSVFIVWLPGLIFRVFTFLAGEGGKPRALTGTMALVER